MEEIAYIANRLGHGLSRVVCPLCAHERRPAHQTVKTMTITVQDDHALYNCHHCLASGRVNLNEDQRNVIKFKKRERPLPTNKTLLPAHAEWLRSRGISDATMQWAGLYSVDTFIRDVGETSCVAFPYGHAAKLRAAHVKAFSCSGSPSSFFMQDKATHDAPLVVAEGECFPGSAEVLTRTGWVSLHEYQGDDILVPDGAGGGKFEKPLAVVRREYSGEMLEYRSGSLLMQATPNHRMSSLSTKGQRRKWRFSDGPASTSDVIERAVMVRGHGLGLTKDQITLCLAVSADASIDLRVTGARYVRFGLKKDRKIERLRNVLSRIGIAASDNPTADGHQSICFHIPAWVPGRMLPWSWVVDATLEEREFILAEMVHWDGNSVPNRNQHEYSSKYYENASWMQAMAHLSGRVSTIIHRSNAFGHWLKASVLHNKNSSSLQFFKKKSKSHSYTGVVHCAQTSSGLVLVRQSGSVYVAGNCDALALHTSGILNAVSVPNGAPAKVSNGKVTAKEDHAFRYVWSAKQLFDRCKKIVIATDNDEPGDALAEELARRIGKYRCWRVRWPSGIKDANDALTKLGAEAVADIVNAAEQWPVAGLYETDHYLTKVLDLYARGEGKGESTGIAALDKLYTIVPGQVTVVTGLPSAGKSEFVDHVMASMAEALDWRFAVCSFENPPATHIVKLLEKYRRTAFYQGKAQRMQEADVRRGMSWITDHFYWIEQADGAASNIDDIIERAKVAVMRYGVRGVVIDPYNYIDKPRDMAETEYVSELMTKLKQFAVGHEAHVWFIAHPTKLKRDESGRIPPPGGYEISGSAAWYAKADCGLTVHRGLQDCETEIHLWKVRFKWVGKQGMTMLAYDPETGRYTDGRTSRLQATNLPTPTVVDRTDEAWWQKEA